MLGFGAASVNAAPNPSISWNFLLGSSTVAFSPALPAVRQVKLSAEAYRRLPLVTRTAISPCGDGTDGASAEAKSAVAVAVNPTPDNFRKVRLVCSFDTGFSWQE